MADNIIKTNAIVVKINQSGENDKILTLLSPEEGKLSVIAKGIRSLKHQSRNACMPLCYSSFVIKKVKDGSSIDIVKKDILLSKKELKNKKFAGFSANFLFLL